MTDKKILDTLGNDVTEMKKQIQEIQTIDSVTDSPEYSAEENSMDNPIWRGDDDVVVQQKQEESKVSKLDKKRKQEQSTLSLTGMLHP